MVNRHDRPDGTNPLWHERLVRRWHALRRQPERGTLAKEALIALGVFFGTAAAVVAPFILLYADRMPRADDGSPLGARRAMVEDPVVFIVIVGGTILAVAVTGFVHRRVRPRLMREETARDVANAARAAASALRTGGADAAAVNAAAASYLLNQANRHVPYEPNRIWVQPHGDTVEVIAERSYQKATGLLRLGNARAITRMDVQARAQARVDGSILGQSAHVYAPAPDIEASGR